MVPDEMGPITGPTLWLVASLLWLVVGVGIMSFLDACTGFRLSREVRARLQVSGWTTIFLLVALWPLGLVYGVWRVFRE